MYTIVTEMSIIVYFGLEMAGKEDVRSGGCGEPGL
jgi:hypothetical protein